MKVIGPIVASRIGVTAATMIWKSHCVHVVTAQHCALRCEGKISLQTFQEMGPELTPKASALVTVSRPILSRNPMTY
jgi:hypothetical protein